MSRKKLRVADFFCGAGGFSEGFKQQGFEIVFALDNWKPAIDTHKLNHPKCNHSLANILELDSPIKIDATIPDVDVIIGSPPCVSFSGSNKAGKADKSLGIQLVESFLRIVSWKKNKGTLKYWILENVPNSKAYIKDSYSWKELGLPGDGPSLKVQHKNVYDAADFGAPQNRSRFFCGDYPHPEFTHKGKNRQRTFNTVLKSLGNPSANKLTGKILDPNYNLYLNAKDLTDHFYDSRIAKFEWEKSRRLKLDHGYMGKMSFPEKLNRPSRTVMATRSASTREAMILRALNNDTKNIGYRLPTIREISSLMSFPITYQFEANNEAAKYRLVGNAVCPNISSALARAILTEQKIARPRNPYVTDRIFQASLNLNGAKMKLKREKEKPIYAIFKIHVPEIKINGMRVELSNVRSQFYDGDIIWDCFLRYGPAKAHKKARIYPDDAESFIKINEKSTLIKSNTFTKFKSDVVKEFKINMPGPVRFQELYYKRSNGVLTPESSLDKIKKIVDKHYPEKQSRKILLDNSEKLLPVDKSKVPIRVGAAAFACSYMVERIQKSRK